MSKDRAIPVWWDTALKKRVDKRNKNTIYFASIFECAVYQQLFKLVGVRNLEMQVPLLIKPKTTNYPELVWRCDFRIYRNSNLLDYLNVEAKGLARSEFKRNVQYLEMFSPHDYKQLLVIGCNPHIYVNERIQLWTLPTAIDYLTKWFHTSTK